MSAKIIYGFVVKQPATVESWRLKIGQTLRAILPKELFQRFAIGAEDILFQGHQICVAWNEDVTDRFVNGFLIHTANSAHDLVNNTSSTRYGTLAEVLTTRKKELDEVLTRFIKDWGLGQWEPSEIGLYLST